MNSSDIDFRQSSIFSMQQRAANTVLPGADQLNGTTKTELQQCLAPLMNSTQLENANVQ